MVDRPGSGLEAWETWTKRSFAWVPYVALAVPLLIAVVSDRDLVAVGLTGAAAAWTWASFTRMGTPGGRSQRSLRVYFVGFVVLGLALVSRHPVFLIYGIAGFYHAALLRPWWTSFVGVAAAGAVVHAHIVFNDSRGIAWAIFLGVLLLQTVTVWGGVYGGMKIAEVAEERRRTVRRLEATMEENIGLHDQLVAQAREAGVLDERQRMAREIHDTIAQGLTGVITQIEATHQSWGDDAAMRNHLDQAAGLARESLDEARRSVQAIKPGLLDHSRLPDALDEVAARWAETSGVAVHVRTTGERRPLHPEIEVTLLRATQEGLANIARHAAASRVGITLSFMRGAVALDIRDDGVGFTPGDAVKAQSFGLAAMRQRVQDVNGVLEVESAPGEGTAISVTVNTDVSGDTDG